MSRIGKQPITVPAGIKVEIDGTYIKISGKSGMLERHIRPEIELIEDDDNILVKCLDKSKRTNAFRGLTRTLINNMILGIDKGFKKKLIVEGVGYKASIAGNTLTFNVGYSNPVIFDLPKGVIGAVDQNTVISLDSIDKELLGLTAARIRGIRKPEPYKGKGIRYENEHIVRKAGKTAAK